MRAQLDAYRAEYQAHPDRAYLEALIEDLEGDLTEEKTIAEAVRKVWRSLWNLRAYDEREYYGIDHKKVYMGIAVHPSFVMEQKEAVAITHLRPDDGAPLYRIVSQLGDIGVVRPDIPGAVPETLVFRRTAEGGYTDLKQLVASSEAPEGAMVWSEAEIAELAGLLFAVQDHFAAEVYAHITDLRLDIELEMTRDDRIVIKQARPYLGIEP